MKTLENLAAEIQDFVQSGTGSQEMKARFAHLAADLILWFQVRYEEAEMDFPLHPSKTLGPIETFLAKARRMEELLEEMGPSGRLWLSQIAQGPLVKDERQLTGCEGWPNRCQFESSQDFHDAFMKQMNCFLAPFSRAGTTKAVSKRQYRNGGLRPGESYRSKMTREGYCSHLDRNFVFSLAFLFQDILGLKATKTAGGEFENLVEWCLGQFQPSRVHRDVHALVCSSLAPDFRPTLGYVDGRNLP